MDEAMLDVRGLTVRFGDFVAVDALDLDARDGEVVCVLGPSGCGKSTLLRAIAGLEPAAGGSIHLAGRDLADLRPDQRGVGLMFQDNVLFPHRSVTDNVVFGLRMHGVSGDALRRRADEVLRLVDLAGAGARSVTELSGGEQQRVALARAIAPRPRLLMLDEPLGSLDRALRRRLLDELPGLLRAVGTTVLYVTHDQDEALELADRVAVMRAGRLLQVDSPHGLWRAPRTEFVARFIGLEHVLDATIRDGVAHTALGALPIGDVRDDAHARIVLLPDALRIVDDRPCSGDEIAIDGQVVARRLATDHLAVQVRTAADLALRVPVWRGDGPAIGDTVTIALDPLAVRRVDGEPDEPGQLG
jgi:thiamine transport system ATP-binding protein